jgi:hypothetical protein
VSTDVLEAEADKLTLGQELQVPHSVLTLMEYKENYGQQTPKLSNSKACCENPCIQLEVSTRNRTTLLPVDSGPLERDCLQVMDEVFSSWPDLTDQPINHLDVEYFKDDSSFVWDSMCFPRYAVVISTGYHWTLSLKHDYCQSEPLHKRLSFLLSYRHSSSLQECE